MTIKKVVIILDEKLPIGLLANASAVLAMTLGKAVEDIIGDSIVDASGNSHLGITKKVLPILKASKEDLNRICLEAKKEVDLFVVDFSDIAQRSKNYQDYTSQLQISKPEEINYLGIAIYGDKKKVNKLSGSLALLR